MVWWRRQWPILLTFVALVVFESGVYRYISRKGVATTGDEPHYLVVAKALLHGTVHPLAAYVEDLRTHQLFNWPAGMAPTDINLQLFAGPHGPITIHSVGFSAILAPFLLLGGDQAARTGLIAVQTAGFMYFFLRAVRLARLDRRATLVAAVVMMAPAVFLAGTQIYPDFLTGVLMACVIVELAALEVRNNGVRARSHGPDWLGASVVAIGLAVLPWLHQQNLVPGILLLAAFAVVAHRGGSWVTFALVATVVVASWLVLLGFNQYGYGHPLGPPQPFPALNGPGFTEILGLLFDRHQGLFVQVPTAVLGVAGLWVARRRALVSGVATVLSAASLLYLNGTFYHAPYGGASFAGRFGWSSLMPLLVWVPVLIAEVRQSARLWVIAVAAALLWLFQLVPIVAGRHVYYNQLSGGPLWDPSLYPGWWGPLDRMFAMFVPGSHLFGNPGFGFLIALVLVAGGVAISLLATRRRGLPAIRIGAASAAVVAVVVVVGVLARPPLPDGSLSFTEGQVGGPLHTAATGASTSAVPLQGVGAGTFEVSVTYRMSGANAGARLLAYCTRGPAADHPAPVVSSAKAAQPGSHVAVLVVACPRGTIWFQMTAQPHTTIDLGGVTLTKTANP